MLRMICVKSVITRLSLILSIQQARNYVPDLNSILNDALLASLYSYVFEKWNRREKVYLCQGKESYNTN